MAGVAGRSGRKSTTDTAKRLAVIDKAWAVIDQALNDPDLDPQIKRDIALAIVLKSIPQQIEGKGDIKITVEHIEVEERLSWFREPLVN